MAEREPQGSTTHLHAWRPTDRHRPASWQSVNVEGATWETLRDGSQKVRATIDGQQRELAFPTEVQRRMSLRTTADWVVRPSLLKVQGVAQVMVLGGGRKQYQVLVDPPALIEHGVKLNDIETALRANNVNFSGGFTVKSDVERPIRVLGRLGPRPEMVLADLHRLPVKTHPDRTILLSQVARITEGPQLPRGDGSVNGEPGVVLTITKQPHVDTRRLTEQIESSLRETESSLPADIVIEPNLYQLRTFIDRGVYNVGERWRSPYRPGRCSALPTSERHYLVDRHSSSLVVTVLVSRLMR
jgi:HME family heavy-metal exporter